MNVLKWVENYLKNLPKRGETGLTGEGCAIDLLDVYGTEGTKGAKMTTYDPSKIPTPPLNRRDKAAIETTLAFVRKNHGW